MAQPRRRGKDAAVCLGFEIPHPAGPAGPITGANMDTSKGVFASKTVWANLVGLASIGLGLAGVDRASIDSGGLAEALSQIVAGASFVASTVFRLRATQRIGG
jgi:hypothetical protein